MSIHVVNVIFHKANKSLHNGKVYILNVKYTFHNGSGQATALLPPKGRDGLLPIYQIIPANHFLF
jgi:hypothetical protein